MNYLFLLMALFLINIPFFLPMGFSAWVLPVLDKKERLPRGAGWLLLDMLLVYLLLAFLAFFIEAARGQVYPQKWEFYAISLTLFFVFSFPGFVYKFLWKK